jgi:hypothetical protein
VHKCQWPNCTNNATKMLYRETSEEERAETMVFTARGVSWAQFIEFKACDDHVEVAKLEYPHMANWEP